MKSTLPTIAQLTREALQFAAATLENDDFYGIWPDLPDDDAESSRRMREAQERAVARIRRIAGER